MLFRIGDNVAVTCKNPNETLLFINRVPTAWLFSIDIEICQKVKRMIVEEQNLKDIKIEYESEDCTTGRVVDLPMDSLHSFTIDYASGMEETVGAGEIIYLKMPVVSANKRGVNDIGWQCDGDDVALYATMSRKPHKTELWSEVKENYVVKKTVSAWKFEN